MRAASAVVLVAASLLAAGCGGASGSTTTTHLLLTKQERLGKRLFVLKCGACHQLADAGTSGTAGPPLNQPWLPSRVLERIVDGPGEMPAGIVRGADAEAVAAYVAAATGG